MVRSVHQIIASLGIVAIIRVGVGVSAIPSCVSPNPDKPLWTLSEWTTNSTSPGGVITFLLSNTFTGYGASCFREELYPEGYCVWLEGGMGEEDDTGTLFTFYERVGLLEIYQEWSCLESEK